MQSLNLGILAHVDAGKTSLTERLLFAAGVIDSLGSVDDGSTQTDSLALERQRGITIKSAVASFAIDDLTVNLIDTPGHPDFIAEVDRVLSVLDGAVLVVSAVEGVQAQTRVLMRALRRLRIPTVVFVNKIDRMGARADLGIPGSAPVGRIRDAGTRRAAFVPYGPAELTELLAEHDDEALAAYLEGGTVTRSRQVMPVFYGSAITGAGVPELMRGISEWLPAAQGDPDGEVEGTVFKIERGAAGEKIAYVRMFAGTLHVRDRLPSGRKITALQDVVGRGSSLPAGHIGRVWGLDDARIGDPLGAARTTGRVFAPPTLETVVESPDKGALQAALIQLAEQDPLINLRQDDLRRELSLSLYGEVQKEVIQATLADDFGIEVSFRESTTLCVERPVGGGEAVEFNGKDDNPFLATVGLRVEPAEPGAGVTFRLGVSLGDMPYAFFKTVEDTVHETLREGLHGWQVADCVVTMTHCGYSPKQSAMHAGFDKSMSSTGADFRGLTPLVLMEALKRAGTRVLEPVHRFRLELPPDTLGVVLPALAKVNAVPYTAGPVVEGEIPAGRVHALQLELPTLTRGEGLMESDFARYEPVKGAPPARRRTDHNPLDRKEYLLHVMRRVG
ncbi:GTP-binding protein [Nonomuraea sp. NPDC050663]|uniref:GTP-binding protein n=1 Tax=Nonomuraea sp. NPDC050663 TaxID=3364370 RepID=UPI003791B154